MNLKKVVAIVHDKRGVVKTFFEKKNKKCFLISLKMSTFAVPKRRNNSLIIKKE